MEPALFRLFHVSIYIPASSWYGTRAALEHQALQETTAICFGHMELWLAVLCSVLFTLARKYTTSITLLIPHSILTKTHTCAPPCDRSHEL
jgi:hypothetical protein